METFRAILAAGTVDLNAKSWRFVEAAVRSEQSVMLDELVQRGAVVNTPAYSDGEFPLHVAVSRDLVEISKQLIRLGAKPNLGVAEVYSGTDSKLWLANERRLKSSTASIAIVSTSLHEVVGHALNMDTALELIRILIEAGADVNQVDQDGYSPLLLAVEKDFSDIVACLLKRGADPWLLSPTGKTVFELASSGDVREALLLHHTALTTTSSLASTTQSSSGPDGAGANLTNVVAAPPSGRTPPAPIPYGRFVMPAAPPRE
jgi:ankyrin repeat protein